MICENITICLKCQNIRHFLQLITEGQHTSLPFLILLLYDNEPMPSLILSFFAIDLISHCS